MANYTEFDGGFEIRPRLPDDYAAALMAELREAAKVSEGWSSGFGPWYIEHSPLFSYVSTLDASISGWWREDLDEQNPWGSQLQDLIDRIVREVPGTEFDGEISFEADEYETEGTFSVDGTEVMVEIEDSGFSTPVRKVRRHVEGLFDFGRTEIGPPSVPYDPDPPGPEQPRLFQGRAEKIYPTRFKGSIARRPARKVDSVEDVQNILYELYEVTDGSGKGVVRAWDLDAGENWSMVTYPTFAEAKRIYDKQVELLRKHGELVRSGIGPFKGGLAKDPRQRVDWSNMTPDQQDRAWGWRPLRDAILRAGVERVQVASVGLTGDELQLTVNWTKEAGRRDPLSEAAIEQTASDILKLLGKSGNRVYSATRGEIVFEVVLPSGEPEELTFSPQDIISGPAKVDPSFQPTMFQARPGEITSGGRSGRGPRRPAPRIRKIGDKIYYTGDRANQPRWMTVIGVTLDNVELQDTEEPDYVINVSPSAIGDTYRGHHDPLFTTWEAYNDYYREIVGSRYRDKIVPTVTPATFPERMRTYRDQTARRLGRLPARQEQAAMAQNALGQIFDSAASGLGFGLGSAAAGFLTRFAGENAARRAGPRGHAAGEFEQADHDCEGLGVNVQVLEVTGDGDLVERRENPDRPESYVGIEISHPRSEQDTLVEQAMGQGVAIVEDDLAIADSMLVQAQKILA